MDRRSWLWRRKSSDKSPGGETESSAGSISSHSERFSDDQVFLNQNYQSTEVPSKTDMRKSEHNDGAMTLSEALASINAKEELVKQHIKVAEEAVSGWEKAEREVLALRQQVEVLNTKNATLEDRVVHLDGALKECLRQLRQTREEKDQIAHDALEKKFSETESSVTSIDVEIYHKLETAEKENSDLKLELSSMAEELEIRLIEMELSNQAAEQASKQHLEYVKKVAMLEAECRVLNSALKKANNQSIAHTTLSLTKNVGSKETSSFEREKMDSLVEIDLMDDFLEMERLAALPESSEADEMFKKVQSLENILKEREKEIKALRNQLEESASKMVGCENELMASRNQLKESEGKLAESKNELKALNDRLKEAVSKLDERENELKASTNLLEEAEIMLAKQENELKTLKSQLQEAVSKLGEHEKSGYRLKEVESKLAECENELSTSREQLEYAESKLVEHEIEHKASRYLLKEAETKLVEREKQLKASRDQLKEAESMLADQANELKASRNRIKEAESKSGESENELNASRDRLEEAECKLEERENELKTTRKQLKEAESVLAKTRRRLAMAESQYKALEAERESLLPKIGTLENDVQKERSLSKKAEARCQQLKDEVSRLQHEVQVTKSANRPKELSFQRVNKDMELALAGSKFAECQKTIASINQQLKTLAMFDDFLLDTNDS
ncbi:filament-like plant protein [Artemisia annua]|uniref:Filament-like plant protein n=1 Tax=Artemisia annua TaxID=35608 RepID=A0A2U1LAL5_ARTAN|nr:filament-like plant protein [Artemisia annua]